MNKWFSNEAPDGDVVISSRVRLARNFKGIPFPGRETGENAKAVIEAAKKCNKNGELEYISMEKLDSFDRAAFVARHLISPPFSKATVGAGILKSEDESLSVMINEEDHLRIQVLFPGNNLEAAYEKANGFDDSVAAENEYAFDETLGYLTKCPTNLGTGLRASVMLHLPALDKNGDTGKLMTMLQKLGLTIRGTFGENTKAVGSIYQISNQVTIGIDEKTSIGNLTAIASQIAEREREARRQIFGDTLDFEDKFSRSYAILSSARLLSGEELYGHLSVLRVGAGIGLMDKAKIPVITELLFTTSAGEIMKNEGRQMTPEERDAVRARVVRESALFR